MLDSNFRKFWSPFKRLIKNVFEITNGIWVITTALRAAAAAFKREERNRPSHSGSLRGVKRKKELVEQPELTKIKRPTKVLVPAEVSFAKYHDTQFVDWVSCTLSLHPHWCMSFDQHIFSDLVQLVECLQFTSLLTEFVFTTGESHITTREGYHSSPWFESSQGCSVPFCCKWEGYDQGKFSSI